MVQRRRPNRGNIEHVVECLGVTLNIVAKSEIPAEEILVGLMTIQRAYEKAYINKTKDPSNLENMARFADSLSDTLKIETRDVST